MVDHVKDDECNDTSYKGTGMYWIIYTFDLIFLNWVPKTGSGFLRPKKGVVNRSCLLRARSRLETRTPNAAS